MFNWEDAEPTFVRLTSEGFIESGIEVPNTPIFISIEIPTFEFHKTAIYSYKLHEPFRHGKALWESGMQARIVTDVRILTDDIESGLFTAANFNNDPTFPFLFAKLLPCELHDKVLEIFKKHMEKF